MFVFFKYIIFFSKKGDSGGPLICGSKAQPVKMDLDKKSLPKQKTVQTLKLDTHGFRVTK